MLKRVVAAAVSTLSATALALDGDQHVVSSNSMLPLLHKGQTVSCDGTPGKVFAPGDIVIYRHPKRDALWIKMIVGLEGDSVRMRDGILHINGRALPTKPAGSFLSDELAGGKAPRLEETLPNGIKTFILDAVRGSPADDTSAQSVPPDHVFVIGANRDNSIDSRSKREHGTVPADNIVCKLALPA